MQLPTSRTLILALAAVGIIGTSNSDTSGTYFSPIYLSTFPSFPSTGSHCSDHLQGSSVSWLEQLDVTNVLIFMNIILPFLGSLHTTQMVDPGLFHIQKQFTYT